MVLVRGDTAGALIICSFCQGNDRERIINRDGIFTTSELVKGGVPGGSYVIVLVINDDEPFFIRIISFACDKYSMLSCEIHKEWGK